MRTAGYEQVWQETERRVNLELQRVRDVASDIRRGTSDLNWQGPGADGFRERTERRLGELADVREMMELLLTLVRRASAEVKP